MVGQAAHSTISGGPPCGHTSSYATQGQGMGLTDGQAFIMELSPRCKVQGVWLPVHSCICACMAYGCACMDVHAWRHTCAGLQRRLSRVSPVAGMSSTQEMLSLLSLTLY